MPDDAEFLRDYAERGSETAFAELVRRRIDLVYSVALRQCGGDAHLATDVVQRVFTDLARKARTLGDRTVLSGWLYRSARYAASDVVRAERRRRTREQEAQTMSEISSEPARDAEWEQLRPALDEVLSELGESDRDAVMLRFFEGRAFREIGATLRLSEDAARMRVDRALEKLRTLLARRGVTSTGAALGLALANQAGVAAPAGLAASVAGTALAGATATGGMGAVTAFFAMSKIKVGVIGIVVAALLVPTVLEVRAHRALEAELGGLRATAGALPALQKENRELTTALAQSAGATADAAELAQLRTRVATLRKRPNGVLDATLKPAAAWQNAGWATPEAALETILWAAEHKQTEEMLRNCHWVGDARGPAEAAFAKLSDGVRARYGSADRFLAEYSFGSRGPENDAAVGANYGTTRAFQILGRAADLKRDGIRVTWWEQMASGHEREKQDTFSLVGDRYVIGMNRWTEQMWQAMVAEIDPVTSGFRPRKIIPLDPNTGRPLNPAR